MSRKVFYAFLLFCLMGALCLVPACADEIELVPSVTYELTASSSATGYTDRVYFEVPTNAYGNNYPINETNCMIGNYTDVGLIGSPVMLSSVNPDIRYGNFPLNRCVNWYAPSSAPDFAVTFHGLHIGLDMGDNLSGYYRYTCDFLLGASFDGQTAYYRQVTIDCTPNYTYSSAPLYIADSETGMHGTVYLVGETDYLYTIYQNSKIQNGLVKFRFESTFYYDSSYGSEVAFDLSPMFSTMIGSFNYDLSGIRAGGVNASAYGYFNNRFLSKLYGNVEPPVTPTPTITPYPGQDTQESINAGVGQIESQVNQIVDLLNPQATPIPTPFGIEIDETLLDNLESMTLPDISDGQPVWSTLWDVFEPLLPFVLLMGTSLTFVYFVMFLLRGGWL